MDTEPRPPDDDDLWRMREAERFEHAAIIEQLRLMTGLLTGSILTFALLGVLILVL